MAVLVVGEYEGGALKDATHKSVTAALALSADVDVLVLAGPDVAAAAAKITGVRSVLAGPAANVAEAIADAVLAQMAGYDAVLFAATSNGKNVAPRVAALLDVSIISDVSAVLSADTFVRPIYAGNALETVQSSDAKKVITVRTTAFAAAAEGGGAAVRDVAGAANAASATFLRAEMVKSERPELTSAKRVVSGGRALGSQEEFDAVIVPLADALGAAVGASRAAVDAGYAPNDYQVGQTGKVVAPELYVAVGISGAIQHLAGMKDSKTIVAINKDPDAPIFAVADFGLVAEYQTAVPALLEALK